MSDPVTAARAARENLARALSALQMPGVPPQLMAVAEPVAHAMSALHRIEASQGAAVAEAGPAALGAARQALSILQAGAGQHPAVDQALEVIAGSLSVIHGLAQAPSVPPFGGAVSGGGPAHAPGAPAAFPQHAAQPAQPAQAMPYAQSPGLATQVIAPPPAQAAAWPQQPAYPAPAAPPPYVPPAPVAQSPAQAAPAPAPAPAGSLRVEAELGAHSSTNFYKGLSGNDVIDSGGIFVSTYQIPEIGQTLSMRVSMPGGYEFEAVGIVRWTREAPNSGSDGQPGYGAQFTQITPEGRQLVYRYVRNREPLFHDDL